MEALKAVEEIVLPAVRWLRLTLEAVGAFWIAVGFSYSVVDLIKAHLKRRTSTFTAVRLTFSRYLSLALEFQLASDILSTAVAPTWDEIGKLASTAVIRTALNYFLSREMHEYAARAKGKESYVLGDAGSPLNANT